MALVVQYIRRSMVEYSDVIWYMSHESDYNKDRVMVEQLYGERNDLDEFYTWRDQNVLLEIKKYGWYIDYWMENGLYRVSGSYSSIMSNVMLRFAHALIVLVISIMQDPNTKRVIDQEAFDQYRLPDAPASTTDVVSFCHHTESAKTPWTTITVPEDAAKKHLDHGDYPGTCEDAAADPEFSSIHNITVPDDGKIRRDPKCNKITNSCRPVQVVSADKLRDSTDGPAETEIIGNILNLNQKTARYVINKDTWTCLWDKVIVKNQGPMTFDDRDIANDPNFSEFMLQEMKSEIQRLVDKYSGDLWIDDVNANRLVSLLSEHIPLLQTEIDDLASGRRILSTKDIFGPGERKARFGKTIKK